MGMAGTEYGERWQTRQAKQKEAGMREGGCLCGEVRFCAEGPPKWTSYCHCRSCRRHTGAPVSAYAGFEKDKVRFTKGTPAYFTSSPGVRRGFCSRCGSTLTYEGERWPTELHLHLGAFDDPGTLAPTGQAFADERIPWLHLG
jgi:hypothetical protein